MAAEMSDASGPSPRAMAMARVSLYLIGCVCALVAAALAAGVVANSFWLLLFAMLAVLCFAVGRFANGRVAVFAAFFLAFFGP